MEREHQGAFPPAAGRRTHLTWPGAPAFYVQYDYDVYGALTKVRENGAATGFSFQAYTPDAFLDLFELDAASTPFGCAGEVAGRLLAGRKSPRGVGSADAGVASALVTLPAALETITLKRTPSSASRCSSTCASRRNCWRRRRGPAWASSDYRMPS